MSGLGVEDWTEEEWQAYEAALQAAGWAVDHCAHCDRSNRHPSCMIVRLPGREQGPLPRPDRLRYQGANEPVTLG